MEITHVIKIEIPAQKATPAPPLGPKVGQYGLNLMNLCKELNAATQHIEAEAPVPIILTIYKNKSFSFEIKSLPTAYLIKKLSHDGCISLDNIMKILTDKESSLTSYTKEKAIKTILGTAKSMGIKLLE